MVIATLPRIYWINLARSRRRRAAMEAALRARGLDAVRVEAVDGRDPASARRIRSRAEDPVVAACLASHLVAIELALRAGEECALFLEDDATFELWDRSPHRLPALLRAMPPGWSALWLGYGDAPVRLDAIFRRSGAVLPLPNRTLWSTVAFVLHRAAMEHLVARYARGDVFDVTAFEGRHEADTVLLGSLRDAAGLLPPYVARAPLFTFAGQDSEIHDQDLPRQRAARAFTLDAIDELLADRYAPRYSLLGRVRRLVRAVRRAGGSLC